MKGLKQRLTRGESVIGTFASLGTAITTEMLARAGFDWLMLDLEHGMGSEADIVHQLQAMEASNCSAIVRVEGGQRQRIHRVLDAGAHGIMCPRIYTVNEAQKVVLAMRYTPEGERGVAKLIRASNFGVDFASYLKRSREELLGVIQIETIESVECVDQIAALDGVDVLFVGPADLSMALGVFGQLDHPKFTAAFDRVVAAAKKHHKAVGFLILNPADFETYYERGVRFFACGTDAHFLNSGARNTVQTLSDLRTQCEGSA